MDDAIRDQDHQSAETRYNGQGRCFPCTYVHICIGVEMGLSVTPEGAGRRAQVGGVLGALC
jgi:hypothetical protein